MSGFEERQRMIAKFRREEGRDPDDAEWLEIYAAARMGRDKPFPWTTGRW
jgi:hypothetical protein